MAEQTVEQNIKQQTIEQKIADLKKITKNDGDQAYSEAQFELAKIYFLAKKNSEAAIKHLLKVEKLGNSTLYATAQFNLAQIYQHENNIEQVKYHYLQIEKSVDPNLYAEAQFNLALIYQDEENNIAQAEYHYLQVQREDNADAYARAQCNLALIYQLKKQDIEQAEYHYLQVHREDNADAYARAQYCLAFIYQFKKQDIKQAERHYLQVHREDNADAYVSAQYHLGLIYQTEKQLYNEASQCFLQCCDSINPVVSNIANFYLGDNIYFKKTEGSLKKAEEYYLKVSYSNDLFKHYIIAQIMLSVIDNNNEASSLFADANKREQSVTQYICDIRTLAENIQKQLLVTFKLNENLKSEEKQYERQVAHYTRPGVLFSLLKNEPSDFRLNVVDFMNDPTENQILTNWLDIKTDRDSEIKSFLASFSFNHNSLNQFRLYGNENNIVGSSVSVVFNQNFFGDDVQQSINPDGINHLNKFTSVKMAKQDFIDNKTDANEKNEPLTQSSFHDLPLFRCLYFDPSNEYISLAKRNKFSFYLEHRESSAAEIEKKWNDYLKQLDEKHKIKTIRKILNQIKQKIKKLKANGQVKNLSILDQLITLAVMPISCLIKHAAFEDEDECRMIYITNIADEKIQAPTDYVQASSLFINYKTVEDYIEKIYLGPQCEAHHKLWITNHFRISSKPRSKLVKVIQSEMPLR
ncbi:tetratricopeptide repeat protein [Gilliamella sp. B2838]|uniref:SEL1-like repeat protein n=1 Tax=Gilliamella sp. B2838 TaxID=2818020 RepID=UPI00226AD4D4|nr:tetratricopeptide repeat protein [Gilliamella sp. B2838]MCX8726539.1 sel1 repeat family protein [Gilliamella sp. B2838]